MAHCIHCNKIITSKYAKKFCNSSCSASYNNLLISNRNKKWCLDTFGKYQSKSEVIIQHKFAPISKTAWGPYTRVYTKICTVCSKQFVSTTTSKLCSDDCYIAVKKKNAKGIKRHYYKGFEFDSHWEVSLAKMLDANNIKWIKPITAIAWMDSTGKSRKYFPDFYLPAFDLYLDPKNPYAIKQQQEKLTYVVQHIRLLYGNPSEIMAQLAGFEPASSIQLPLSCFVDRGDTTA
jgi:hypothetical protein